MKILLVLWGESYRSGPHLSDNRGYGDYVKRQVLASKSHIKLIKHLTQGGNEVDILINTYKLNELDDNNLYTYYNQNSNVIFSIFHDIRLPSENDLFINIFNTVADVIHNYEIVILIRIDLYLKKLFFEKFTIITQNIMFAHIDSNIDLNSNDFNICQQIFSVPKKFFGIISNKILNGYHPHLFRNVLISHGINKDDIIYLTPTLHVCSTDFGWNPFYIQVGRSHSTKYDVSCPYSPGVEYYYNSLTHSFVHDVSLTVDYYKNELNIDSLEENLILTESSFNEITN